MTKRNPKKRAEGFFVLSNYNLLPEKYRDPDKITDIQIRKAVEDAQAIFRSVNPDLIKPCCRHLKIKMRR